MLARTPKWIHRITLIVYDTATTMVVKSRDVATLPMLANMVLSDARNVDREGVFYQSPDGWKADRQLRRPTFGASKIMSADRRWIMTTLANEGGTMTRRNLLAAYETRWFVDGRGSAGCAEVSLSRHIRNLDRLGLLHRIPLPGKRVSYALTSDALRIVDEFANL